MKRIVNLEDDQVLRLRILYQNFWDEVIRLAGLNSETDRATVDWAKKQIEVTEGELKQCSGS